MALPIDQKEYLKRYLSADSEDQNKKKRRKKVKTSVKVTRTFTIVDDDVDIHALAPGADKQDEINNPLMDDEMPVVAGVIDERPKDEVLLEQYRTSNKWKLMGQDGQAKQKKDQGLMTRRKNRHDSTDSDLSPPRKQSHGKRDVDSDVSPSRQRQRAEEFSDLTPPRKELDRQNRKRGDGSSSRLARHDSNSDVSPPRNRQETKGNRSHAKKKRHDSDSDLSPPRGRQDRRDNRKGDRPHVRQKRHDSDSDVSPPRRKDDRIENTEGDRTRGRQTRHYSDSDMSPRRREKDKRGSKSSEKSQPRHARHDSDADLSPPRRDSKSRGPVTNRRTKQGSDSDLSPPRRDNKGEGKNVCRSPTRRTRHDSDSDLSPSRKGQLRHGAKRGNKSATSSVRHDMDSDMSPPRPKRKGDSDSDLSPVRKSVPQKGRRDPKAELSPRDRGGSRHPERTLAGTSAGLSDAKTMRRENEDSRRRNTDMYSKMDNELSGRNAKTIFRDKTGRTRDLESEKRKKREDETKKTQEDQKFVEWGKGVAQSAQQKSNIQDALHEMSKPLARYRDDRELDDMLKEAEREGDPMMQFLKKKSSKKQAATGVKALPKYKGPLPPPNRFNIMPGYRWDGVNRSSGFEKKFFERQADKKAMKEVAYKWSTEDM